MAKLAIQQFGSIEKYTEEMKHNLKHFSEIMEKWQSQISEEIRREDKFLKLASHKGDNVSSKAVQQLVSKCDDGDNVFHSVLLSKTLTPLTPFVTPSARFLSKVKPFFRRVCGCSDNGYRNHETACLR